MNNIEEGMVIKCAVIQGSNEIISKTMVEYLKLCAIDNEILPIPDNKTLAMQVINGEIEEVKDGEKVILKVIMTAKIIKI